ncbi:MAG TPA: hypothetical protein VII00_08610 [bacterium]
MGNSRATPIFFILILLPLIFSCCINIEQKIKLRSNGSGSAVIAYSMPGKIYKNSPTLNKIRNYIPVEERDLENIYSKKPGVKIKGTSVNRTEKTRELKIKLEFDNIENLSDDKIKYRLEQGSDSNTLHITVLNSKIQPNDSRKGASAENPLDESGVTQLLGQAFSRFHIKIIIFFPSRVRSSSSGKFSDNKVEWDLPLTEFYKEKMDEITLTVNYDKTISLWQKMKEKIGL